MASRKDSIGLQSKDCCFKNPRGEFLSKHERDPTDGPFLWGRGLLY